MVRIKIVEASGHKGDLQKKIDSWLESKDIEILSTSVSMGESDNGNPLSIISIVYKEKQ